MKWNWKCYLLGILTDGPINGYSLHKHLFKPVRPQLSQIYRALNELADDGLVKYVRTSQEKLPAKNMYTVTEAGYEALKRWMNQPVEIEPIQESFMQWFSLGVLNPTENIVENLTAFKKEREGELDYYHTHGKATVRRLAKRLDSPLHKFYWNLAVDYMIQRAKLDIKWAEATLRKVEKIDRMHHQKNPVNLKS